AAAYYPSTPLVLIPLSYPLALSVAVFRRISSRTCPPALVELIAPGRQHSYVHTELVGLIDNIIHVLEVSFIRFVRVIVMQGFFSDGVGDRQPFQFCQYDSLDYRKTLRCPIL